MYPEYLYNNDTQDIIGRLSELAASDEPTLCAHCQEVSRQTDTSSLCLQKECVDLVRTSNAILEKIDMLIKELSQSLAESAGVFRTQDGKSDFPSVCHTVVCIEEERQHLLACVAELSQMRFAVAAQVAEANQVLHVLSLAKCAAHEEVRSQYAEAIHQVDVVYARLKALDVAVREVQNFDMALVESHLSVFVQRLRISADFNHAGASLDRAAIRALCKELLILLERAPNVSF